MITGELVTELALEGDEVSRMVLGQIGRKLGVGLANFVNIFNPEVIVVGGGAMAAGDLLLEPAREEMMRARAAAQPRPGADRGGAVRGRGGHARRRRAGFRRAGRAGSRRGLNAMRGRLVVCPTPIGNLEDVTLRVLRVLGEADVIACEDTRHTRKLLDRHGIDGARLVSYHEHNERARARRAGRADRVRRGRRAGERRRDARGVGPGLRARARVRRARTDVEVLPGPSAVVTALVASALPADRWRFAGFLPRKAGALRAELEQGEETLVAFESPGRLPKTLALLAEIDPERQVAVCRELTKLHEEVVRGPAREVAERFAEGARGEIVLVIGPGAEGAADESEARDGGRGAGRGGRQAARGGEGRLGADRRAGEPALPGLESGAMDLAEYRKVSHATWERMAAGWDRRRAWMWDVSHAVGEQMVSKLDPQPGQTVLELAAGTGETGFAAAARLGDDGRLISTDFSAPMVEAARRRAEELGLANVEFQVMDAEHMTLDDDSVDGVLCRWGYMLMADPRRRWRRLAVSCGPAGASACRSGDRRRTTSGRRSPEGRSSRPAMRRRRSPATRASSPCPATQRIRELVTGAGFETVEIERVEVEYRFEDFDDYWRFLHDLAGAVALVLERLSADELARVRTLMEEKAQPFRSNGGYTLPGVALNAVAS